MYLPSLKSIEAFEAAAKHLNFTRAANDLNLTSAAISQRVAALEEELGYALFNRRGPRLELTEAGKICRPVLIQSLRQMREAIGSLREITDSSVLTVKTSPSFAQKWLIPRLRSFRKQNPDIDIRVLSTTQRVDIHEGEQLMAIYYGTDPTRGLAGNLAVDPMFDERVFPVCSPSFAKAHGPFKTLKDLTSVPLIHDDTMQFMRVFPSWERWCQNFEIENVDVNRGLRFVVSSLALQGALEGHGMALGRGALVREDLKKRRLVKPFAETYPLNFEYLFVSPKFLAQREDFVIFREWLLTEASAHAVRKTG